MTYQELIKSYKIVGAVVAAFVLVGIATVGGYALATKVDWSQFSPPKTGTVVEKRYEPARTYQEYDYCKYRDPVVKYRSKYDFDGKYQGQESYIDYECRGGYVERYDDEDFMIKLKSCKMKNDGTEKCRTGWREIQSARFKTLKVGDFYDGKKV